jgi:DNA polymerase V
MMQECECYAETIYRYDCEGWLALPLFLAAIPAGFPSPADDYIDRKLDLNELLIRHPAATFFVRVAGDSMVGAGIHSGDILIVDRALPAEHNRIVIAVVNGELTVKRLSKQNGKLYLVPENDEFAPMEVTPEMQFEIWGVVAHVVHSL